MLYSSTTTDQDFSIYVHLPFCRQKCPYCSFYVIPYKKSVANVYIETLKKEWDFYKKEFASRSLISLYFGGGTPSLHPEGVIELIALFKETFSMETTEISVEVNPEDGTLDLFKALKKAGVNRLSLGAQTLSNPLLKQIGRTHTTGSTLLSIENAKACGFSNISIDLMTELPTQTLNDIENTLNQIQNLDITHVSLYNLQIEKGTVFYKQKEQLVKKIASDEIAAQMLKTCIRELESMGFERYEISAFCKKGKASIHNLGYWTGREFLGLGASSFSYIKQERFQNFAHINRYTKLINESKKPIDFKEKLSPSASLLELFTLHLRLTQGFSLASFEHRHGKLSTITMKEIVKLCDENFIKKSQNGDLLSLSSKGALFFDEVAPRLIE
ncbi:coproporphyrinogen III oxidase [Candidatus Aerophobetes bacterium]|uniref:Heme chaperone HemW n=1 Tax=Aerophobetes bacterium TaxID=2030807 RepID=A0A2A4X0J3_UNCAE|nr:MAG: coproporphyrinogen III oxidase [Candidatus Aerophobetes bacterium]